MNNENIKYRIAITEYRTLNGFGNSCSIEKEFDTIESVRNALKHCETVLSEGITDVTIVCNGSNMGFMIIDNSTNIILTKINAHAYTISEDGREVLYRSHKITTEFDTELLKDVFAIHRIDGRPYVFRSNIQHALDTIDWLWCTMENANIAKTALTINKKEGE